MGAKLFTMHCCRPRTDIDCEICCRTMELLDQRREVDLDIEYIKELRDGPRFDRWCFYSRIAWLWILEKIGWNKLE